MAAFQRESVMDLLLSSHCVPFMSFEHISFIDGTRLSWDPRSDSINTDNETLL